MTAGMNSAQVDDCSVAANARFDLCYYIGLCQINCNSCLMAVVIIVYYYCLY